MGKLEEYLKLSISEIEKKIEENNKILEKIDGGSWNEFKEKCRPYWDDNQLLLNAETILTPIEEIVTSSMSNLDKRCRVPIKTFKSWCDCHAVVESDGVGYYATKDKVSNLIASPRAFHDGCIRSDFEYVCWYNK